MAASAALYAKMEESMTGEEIQALVNKLPPITPGSMGRAVQAVAILLGIISVVVVSLRVYVRAGLSGASSRLWGPEDYLAVIGTLPFIPAVVFAVLATRYGVGTHDADLPSPDLYSIRSYEYMTYWELLYFISSTIMKCAIGLTCIRLDKRRQIVIPIAINIIVIVIIAILGCIYVIFNCRPLAATWIPALGTCQEFITLSMVSYIVSAFQMVTDWICAFVPFFIVARLQMSRRKKVSVICILGLGIFASVATCVRIPYAKYYDVKKYPTETAYHIGPIMLASNIECGLGIIGCSLPPLRKLFKFYYGSSADSKGYKYPSERTDGIRSNNPGIKLDSLPGHHPGYHASAKGRDPLAQDLELDDDDSSRKGIMRRTEVHVTSSDSHA